MKVSSLEGIIDHYLHIKGVVTTMKGKPPKDSSDLSAPLAEGWVGRIVTEDEKQWVWSILKGADGWEANADPVE